MIEIIGYYLGAFLFTWGLACLFTFKKVRALDETARKEYKKKRLIVSLVLAFCVALIIFGLSMVAHSSI